MRLRIRDNWIGWTPSAWAKGLGPGGWDFRVAADALLTRLDAAISEIRWEDLALRQLVAEWEHDPHSLQLRAICLLVADLIDQGWEK
jgi:hypothetical protein